MCMPGKGTLKGGTMTGGKAGRAAVGWATLWGKAAGSRGTVCTAVTGDGIVETVTTVTGDTTTVEVTVATGFRSATTVALWGKTTQERVSSECMHFCVSNPGVQTYLPCSQRGRACWILDWRRVCARGLWTAPGSGRPCWLWCSRCWKRQMASLRHSHRQQRRQRGEGWFRTAGWSSHRQV